MILYLINTIPKLKGALWTVIIAIAIVVIKAQYDNHYFSGSDLALRLSAYGMYGNANDLALALVLAWPITYKLWELENAGLKKIILFGLLSLFTLSLLFTASRGGILGFSIVSVLTILTSRATVGFHKGLFITLIVLGIVVVGYPRVLSRPDVDTFVGGDVSADNRLDAWMAGIYMFLSHPVLGVGYGHYMDYAPYYGAIKGIAAHNTLIKVAAETGVLGLLAFVGMLGVAFKRNWKLIKTIPSRIPNYALAQAFFISLVGFVVNTTFSTKDGDWLLYVILAGSAVLWHLNKSNRKNLEEIKVS